MLEIDQLDDRVRLPSHFVLVDLRLQQERVCPLVRFKQSIRRLTEDFVAQLIELTICQPALSIRREIQRTHGFTEDAGKNPFAKRPPMTIGGIERNTHPLVSRLPT